MIGANDPFLLNCDGKKTYFLANAETETVELHRKYPVESIHKELLKYFSGTLEASCDRYFRKCDTIGVLSSAQGIMLPAEFPVDGNRYSFFRISPSGDVMFVNELSFFDDTGNRIYAEPLQSTPDDRLMQDGDILTSGFFMWPVSFAIPKGASVSRVSILPRNDGNGIYSGDEYGLFYFDKSRQWASCGKITADSSVIRFDGVPKGALLLLKNLSRGRQERIFIYKSEKQYFY